ncbi:MAG: hypothetical protein ACPK7O_07140 [Methanobacterium sp.]
MESSPKMIILLKDAQLLENDVSGSKTKNLSIALNNGFKVPPGFCITTVHILNLLKKIHYSI